MTAPAVLGSTPDVLTEGGCPLMPEARLTVFVDGYSFLETPRWHAGRLWADGDHLVPVAGLLTSGRRRATR